MKGLLLLFVFNIRKRSITMYKREFRPFTTLKKLKYPILKVSYLKFAGIRNSYGNDSQLTQAQCQETDKKKFLIGSLSAGGVKLKS